MLNSRGFIADIEVASQSKCLVITPVIRSPLQFSIPFWELEKSDEGDTTPLHNIIYLDELSRSLTFGWCCIQVRPGNHSVILSDHIFIKCVLVQDRRCNVANMIARAQY